MSKTNTIGKHKTRVYDENGYTHVKYHQTNVVSFNEDEIILRSGGWQTNTTKLRINQTSNQFGLGIGIKQHKWQWFIMFKELGKNYHWIEDEEPFHDGIRLVRKLFGVNIVPSVPIEGIPANT